MEARLPDGTALDAEDVDVIVGLLQTALPRRTRDEAAACLSRHAWNLQSALQHIQGPAGLEQGVMVMVCTLYRWRCVFCCNGRCVCFVQVPFLAHSARP